MAMDLRDSDDDSEAEDPEAPDASDRTEDDEDEFADTIPCPHCGKPIYEQAEICPHCGKYISSEEVRSRKPIWFIVAAVLCLIVILIFWIGH
jgi:predicted nucleic acid-binding Zn ribbon protein